MYSHDNDDATDDEDKDDYDYDDNDPVGPITADIQKQQAIKTVRLLKKGFFDPMAVTVHDYNELDGVQANSAKHIVTLLSNELKYDSKMRVNMTELLQTNRMRAVALLVEATLDCYHCGIKSDEQKQKCLQLLANVFKDTSRNNIRSTLKVKIKSVAQEFPAAFVKQIQMC